MLVTSLDVRNASLYLICHLTRQLDTRQINIGYTL